MRTIEQIDAERSKLLAEEEVLKSRLRGLARERDAALAHAKVMAMPAAEREALMIAAAGIASASKVGTPGGR